MKNVVAAVYAKSKWLIVFFLLIIVGFGSQLSKLSMDGSIEGFLGKNDPQLQFYNDFKRQFGNDGDIVITISSEEIFTIPFLSKIKTFHQKLLNEVPFVEDITSLYNARDSRGSKTTFKVENLLEPLPGNDQHLLELKQRVLNNPLYAGLLISEDLHTTSIFIKPNRYSISKDFEDENHWFELEKEPLLRDDFISPSDLAKMVTTVRSISKEMNSDDFKIHIGGSPVASTEIVSLMSVDMPKFARLSVLLILLSLVIITRKVSYIILPILVIASSVITTFSVMTMFNTPLKPPSQMLLSIIIVASICATVHLLSVHFRYISQGYSKIDAVSKSALHCLLPITFTSITTAVGLLALSSSTLAPIVDLGVFGAVAIIAVSIYSFAFFIIYMSVYKFWKKASDMSTDIQEIKDTNDWVDRTIFRISFWSINNTKTVTIVTVCFLLLSVVGIVNINVSHNALNWLHKENQVRIDTESIDKALSSSISLEVVISSDRPFGIQDSTLLRKLDDIAIESNKLGGDGISVGKIISLTDIAKEINKTVKGNDYNYFEVPQQEMISKNFLLFENSGSDDLEYYANTDYSQTRFTTRLPWLEAFEYRDYISKIESLFLESVAKDYTVTITGIMAILAKTSSSVVDSMISSYLISGILISLLMIWVLKTIPIGLASMIPNLLPVIAGLGVMGFSGISLDTFTLTIGSIALGLIVDDTIHFFHTFQRNMKLGLSLEKTLENTTNMVGKPILITSLVLTIGFSMYLNSSLSNIRGFGIVMVCVVIFALVAELFVSPIIANKWFQSMDNNKI